LIEQIHVGGSQSAAHQRTLVLLPYAQLLPIAREQWLAAHPTGLMPRFETTATWAASLPPVKLEAEDFRHHAAHDSLRARAMLLQKPSTRDEAESLYPQLLGLCNELAPLATSCPPNQRRAWGQRWQTELPALLPDNGLLDRERQLQAMALVWLGYSGFASDVLFDAMAGAAFDQLIVVDGLRPEPLAQSVAQHWQAKAKSCAAMPLAPP